jgi:hypothetical protein
MSSIIAYPRLAQKTQPAFSLTALAANVAPSRAESAHAAVAAASVASHQSPL